MAWWKGDDKAHTNGKLKAAQLDGVGLYFLATSWCSDEETDGFVPVHMVPTLAAGLSKGAIAKIVTRLTTVQPGEERPLWHVEAGGYRINDYLVYNPTHKSLEERRQLEKDRIEKKRREKEAERESQRRQLLSEQEAS